MFCFLENVIIRFTIISIYEAFFVSASTIFIFVGLLTMILKAFFFGEVPDIYFVPVNISYDRIFEESLFAYELLGIPKPKESTSVSILKLFMFSYFANIIY